jgi:hypothetical protein
MATRQTQLFGQIPSKWEHIDGIENLNRKPTDAEIRWGVTAEEVERRHVESPEPSRENERRCMHCGRRVTERPDGTEAGHAAGYRLSPDEVCHQHPTAEARDESL